ncbi:MAG: hypothetical protein EBZ48_08320, partial [Proteobacteria bacterium]|nr:hypothetical protein [Pseudomonadota bacterium]
KLESVFGRVGAYALLGEELPLNPKSKAAQAPVGVFKTKDGGEVIVAAGEALLDLTVRGDAKLAQALVAPDNSPLSKRCRDLSDRTVTLLSAPQGTRTEHLNEQALFPKLVENINAALGNAKVVGAATRKEPDSSTFVTTVELLNVASTVSYYCLLWEPKGDEGRFVIAGAGTAQKIFKEEQPEKLGLATVKLFPTESGRWYAMSADTGLPQVRIEFGSRGAAVGMTFTGAQFKAEAAR